MSNHQIFTISSMKTKTQGLFNMNFNLTREFFDVNNTFVISTESPFIDQETRLRTFVSHLRQESLVEIIIYSILFVIGVFGNVFVLFHLKKSRYKSKMNFLIRHLGLADLSVIFITILTEIIWRITVKWETNEFGCKAVQFGRIFPLYLTSMMVICITLDRFYAFVFPLSILKSKERNKCFLITSYVISFTASIPNALIFHIESHPQIPGFTQCVTRNAFPTKWMELAYNAATLCGFYFIPLGFIVICYTSILRNMDTTAKDEQKQLLSLNKSMSQTIQPNLLSRKDTIPTTISTSNRQNVIMNVAPEGQNQIFCRSSSSSKHRSSTQSTNDFTKEREGSCASSSSLRGFSCFLSERFSLGCLRTIKEDVNKNVGAEEEEVFVKPSNQISCHVSRDYRMKETQKDEENVGHDNDQEMMRKELLLRRLGSLDPLPPTITPKDRDGLAKNSPSNLIKDPNGIMTKSPADQCHPQGCLSSWTPCIWTKILTGRRSFATKSLNRRNNKTHDTWSLTSLEDKQAVVEKQEMKGKEASCQSLVTSDTKQIHRLMSSKTRVEKETSMMHVKSQQHGKDVIQNTKVKCDDLSGDQQQMEYLQICFPSSSSSSSFASNPQEKESRQEDKQLQEQNQQQTQAGHQFHEVKTRLEGQLVNASCMADSILEIENENLCFPSSLETGKEKLMTSLNTSPVINGDFNHAPNISPSVSVAVYSATQVTQDTKEQNLHHKGLVEEDDVFSRKSVTPVEKNHNDILDASCEPKIKVSTTRSSSCGSSTIINHRDAEDNTYKECNENVNGPRGQTIYLEYRSTRPASKLSSSSAKSRNSGSVTQEAMEKTNNIFQLHRQEIQNIHHLSNSILKTEETGKWSNNHSFKSGSNSFRVSHRSSLASSRVRSPTLDKNRGLSGGRPSGISVSLQSERRTVIMARAKKKTLRMSISIVVTFCVCWTPYAIMLMWQVYDAEGLKMCVSSWIRYLLYIFAVGNSVINPFVHSHHIFIDCIKRYRKRRLDSKSESTRGKKEATRLTPSNETYANGTASNDNTNQLSPTHL